ncbi:MAG: hypothetical protein KKA73_07840 [Chloroflexi bacterium]|nr:hypothetical protein [Chloroflexota bacterium]MBU1747584.1 hypothetical protein [Chloroflexota bacterium]
MLVTVAPDHTPSLAWARLIDHHGQRYPAWEPRDVYKLLYQGLCGPAHLIASPADFAARLRAEYEAVAPNAGEPLWEVVRPDGRLGRVHLRPFKARFGDLAALTRASLATAGPTWGTPEDVRTAWAAFVAGCRAGRWAFALPPVLDLTRWLEEHEYPAVHHSASYRAAYHSAYRLVGREWHPWLERGGITYEPTLEGGLNSDL